MDLSVRVVVQSYPAGRQPLSQRVGDNDEPFYDALINMLERFATELRNSSARRELYAQFHPRLLAMRRTSDIGWGYGDFVQETIDDLNTTLGE